MSTPDEIRAAIVADIARAARTRAAHHEDACRAALALGIGVLVDEEGVSRPSAAVPEREAWVLPERFDR